MENLSFLNALFEKATSLKKLSLNDIALTKDKAKTINFSLLPKTLCELSLEFNNIDGSSFVNEIFKAASSLEIISLNSSNIDN